LVGYLEYAKYAELDGGTVCYVDVGSGPALLFVHGIGASISNWAPNIEYFRRSHRVIALDLPGFGRSEFPFNDCSLETFTGAIVSLLEQLGVRTATVAGNSLGGLIALHLTLEHPELVRNLVLVDSAGAHGFPRPLQAALQRLPSAWLKPPLLFFISRLPEYRWAHRLAGFEVENEYTRAMVEEASALRNRSDIDTYMETYIRAARTALCTRLDDRLREIDKPVLLVWGQKDFGVPLKVGQRMNRLMGGSFLVALSGAGHVSMLDKPAEFNAALERFLAGSEAR
jgi:pimeloyl-ACP methyl ester carboxylesterase